MLRFQCALSVFDRLAKYGVTVQPDQRYFTQFSCWDLESCGASIAEDDPATSSCLQYLNRQYVIAASVKSTLPPFDIAVCLRSPEYDPRGLVSEMVDYFNEIGKHAAEYEMTRLQSVFDQIDSKVEDYTRTAEDATDPEIAAYSESTAKQLEQLRNRLEVMCKKHVFFGFCSARYDTKLIMQELVSVIFEKGLTIDNVLVQHGDYILVETPHFILRDFARLCAPGTSLDQVRKHTYVCASAGTISGSFVSVHVIVGLP